MLKYKEKRKSSISTITVYEGFGYEVEVNNYSDGRKEILAKPIKNTRFSPEIDIIDDAAVISLNLQYINIKNASKVIEGITNAEKVCEIIKEMKL